jgi:hypothetical protein
LLNLLFLKYKKPKNNLPKEALFNKKFLYQKKVILHRLRLKNPKTTPAANKIS